MPRPKHADRQVQERIACRLRAARVHRGWTQEQLAEALDVATETVSRYEVGRAPPSLPMLVRIADVLGVNVESLLSEEPTEPTLSETQFLRGWRLLDHKEQSMMLNLVEHLNSIKAKVKTTVRTTARQAHPSHNQK